MILIWHKYFCFNSFNQYSCFIIYIYIYIYIYIINGNFTLEVWLYIKKNKIKELSNQFSSFWIFFLNCF
ncbi:MAG: hypothetical protein N7Q72_05130, partial [Spiroplasma sp. Tabriz.8]|nr:hypothetical protein [Spiroplasma sp. Tabriz.8]